jgi:hypothetical protein
MNKKEIFVEMYSGEIIYPLGFNDPGVFKISDIAHHLSMINRYNGATYRPYSVAEHCLKLAAYAEKNLQKSISVCLNYLMHDAAEAYLQDIIGPLKCLALSLVKAQYDIQSQIEAALDIPVIWSNWDTRQMHECDKRICLDERAHFHPYHRNENLWDAEKAGMKPLGVKFAICPIDFKDIKMQFITTYHRYQNLISKEEERNHENY